MLRGDAPLKNEMHLFFTLLMLFSDLNAGVPLYESACDICVYAYVASELQRKFENIRWKAEKAICCVQRLGNKFKSDIKKFGGLSID